MTDDRHVTLVNGRVVAPGQQLTQRELAVIQLAADGLPDFEIAVTLFLSPHTIKTHVRSALVKLNARSRTQAAAIALRRGLIN